MASGAERPGVRHFQNGLPVEDVNWINVAGQPKASDAVGAYPTEQLLRMNANFVAAVEGAFASGEESRAAAFASYRVRLR
jgi:hypothetical protein